MKFNNYFHLEGKHAFLGASKYHWLNYTDDKLRESFMKHLAKERGTRLHKFAEEAIELNIKLPRTKSTLNMYVNDVIGYKMLTEQILYYSDNCFGTADAISFKKNILRIFDYKSGVTPANMKQLEIYTALFCLEYSIDPTSIELIDLRLYQSDTVIKHSPEPDEIRAIMFKIKESDDIINTLKNGGYYGY